MVQAATIDDLPPEKLAALERQLEAEYKRRSVRKSLLEWSRYKGYDPAAHHRVIIKALEDFIADDELDVLLLHAPPGSAKSTYVSVLFPSWYLANFPQNNILFATHSADFAQRWGRKVRNDIMSDSDTLGITMSNNNAASDRWALNQGGEYYAVGAGVGISGFRADLGLCDDLFGSREDAWSDVVREKRWNWYVDDFGHRLKPRAKRVLMNTRWHEDDVAGRIIEQIENGSVRGKIITIPAIAEKDDPVGREPGQYLWDDETGYNYGSFLRSRQKETSPMMWSALFQQHPAPEQGDYFKAEWLFEHKELPERDTLKVYGASDYAVTADGGDYTVHVIVGMDNEGRPWLLDLWRGQTDSAHWIDAFCDLVLKWRPVEWADETGQIKSALGPFIDKRCQERGANIYRRQFATRGDKAVRAQGIRGVMAMRGLHVEAKAPYWPALRAELLSFPSGKHDDQVDALGLIGTLCSVSRGERRGMNALFYPTGNHGIEPEYIRPLAKSSGDFKRLLGSAEKEAFSCSRSEEELKKLGHTGALNWIARFRTDENVKKLASSRARWYEMNAEAMSELVMPMAYGGRLFVGRLSPSAFVDQRLIRLDHKDGVDVELCHALLNSTISMFIIEGLGFGRGLGALDLNKDRIEQYLHVLDPSKLKSDQITRIKKSFLPLLTRDIMGVADELDQADRQAFDAVIIESFGLNLSRDQLYENLEALVEIRATATDSV